MNLPTHINQHVTVKITLDNGTCQTLFIRREKEGLYVSHELQEHFYARLRIDRYNDVAMTVTSIFTEKRDYSTRNPKLNTPLIEYIEFLEHIALLFRPHESNAVKVRLCEHVQIRRIYNVERNLTLTLDGYWAKIACRNRHDLLAFGYKDANPREYVSTAHTLFDGTHTVLELAPQFVYVDAGTFEEKIKTLYAQPPDYSLESAIKAFEEFNLAVKDRRRHGVHSSIVIFTKKFNSASTRIHALVTKSTGHTSDS